MAKRERLEMRSVKGGAYFDPPSTVDFFSSGCGLFDCVLGGGWAERTINLVGDKSTGKTELACEAGANYLRVHPDAKVWYREAEAAFDEHYVSSLGIPVERFEREGKFQDVEDIFEDLFQHTKAGVQGLYIVDSLDALSDRAEQERGMSDGSYGMEKAKKLNELFRRLNQRIAKTKITLMFVSQIRDKVGVRFGEKYARMGGHSLDFYASQIVWLRQTGVIKRTIKGVNREVGIHVHAKVKKNKVGMPFRECSFPIIFGFGVEDVLAGIQWLKDVKALEEGGFTTEEYKYLSSLPVLAKMSAADYNKYRSRIRKGVRKVWRRIEQDFAPKRLKY